MIYSKLGNSESGRWGFSSFRRVGLVFAFLGFALSGRALTFNLTFDTSVTSLTNAATVEAAVGTAAAAITNQFTNAVTIYLGVYWGNTGPFSGGVGLASSRQNLIGTNGYQFSYSQITNLLRTLRNSADDSNSVAAMTNSDPLASQLFWLPIGQARALRMYPATGTNATDGMDGAIGFGNYPFTFSPTNRAVAGEYDFIGLAEHEITEVMGRTCGLNRFGDTIFEPYDLFRYTNNGARSTNVNDKGVYFSVNKGLTALKYFYTNVNLQDIQDWLPSTPADSDDASSPTGQILVQTPADFTALDVLGFNAPMATNLFYAAYKRTNGAVQLSFTNTPGATFSVLYSTNLNLGATNWSFLGNPTQSSSGHFIYLDPIISNGPPRFYRIRSP